jgi:hypothetical protein
MGNQTRNTGGSDRSRAVLMRDAALARVSRTRRWVIVGAAALTAGFAALVSAVAPGRSLASKKTSGVSASETASASTAGSSSSSSSSIPALPPPASAGDLGLQSPDQAPSSDDQSQGQSAQPQPQPQSQQSQPQQQQPQPVAPQSSGGGGGGVVTSGGS